jgi:hypothetical protein
MNTRFRSTLATFALVTFYFATVYAIAGASGIFSAEASVPVLAFNSGFRGKVALLVRRHLTRYGDALPYPSSMFAGLETGPYVHDNHSLFKYGVERGAEAAHYLDKDPAEDAAGYRTDALSAEVHARQYGGHLPPICDGDAGALSRYEYGVVAGVDHRLGAGGRAKVLA